MRMGNRELLRFFLSVTMLYFLSGCGGSTGTLIHSQPDGAFVKVDGVNVGKTPVKYKFDWDDGQTYVITANKDGYVDWEQTIGKKNSLVKGGKLRIILEDDPSFAVTTDSEATNKWLRIPTNEAIGASDLWQKIVDSVTTNYDSIEQVDSESGYMRSTYKIQTFKSSQGILRIRTQFICAVADRTPLVYKVKIVSQKCESIRDIDTIREDQWKPHNRIFKSDKDMLEELLNRLQ